MSKFSGDIDKVNDVYYELTKSQLEEWGVKYHELHLGKQSFDYFIDDKNLTIDQFKSMVKPKVGFIAGAFDVIHPGYIQMFQFMKKNCDYLIVALHKDPSLERDTKLKPVLTTDERKEMVDLTIADKRIDLRKFNRNLIDANRERQGFIDLIKEYYSYTNLHQKLSKYRYMPSIGPFVLKFNETCFNFLYLKRNNGIPDSNIRKKARPPIKKMLRCVVEILLK